MKDTLKEIVCESLQDDECIGHCNHPYCYKVNAVVDNLMKHNVVLAPCAVGDTVYYISGIHGKLVKPARVDEIYFNGTDFGLSLVTENNVYFDIPAERVHYTKESAEEIINGSKSE